MCKKRLQRKMRRGGMKKETGGGEQEKRWRKME